MDRIRIYTEKLYNPESEFKVEDDELINLIGGIPSGVDQVNLSVHYNTDLVIKVEVYSNLHKVIRTIDFKEKVIFNSGMEVTKKGQGIGTQLFLNQVKAARRNGFTRLKVFAQGRDGGDWDGSYRWGRVGFKMDIEDDNEFMDLMERHFRNECSLGELLLSEEGCKLWETINFSWSGTFYLADESESMKYLIKYLKHKNINFRF